MNEIEKKIYEAGRLHPISQSSEKILEAFDKKRSRRIQKKYFFIPVITTLLASATAVAVVFALNPRQIHLQGQTNGFDDGSSVLTSLVSDLSGHYYIQPAIGEHGRIFYAPASQDEFYQVAKDIDDAYYSYSYYYAHRDGFNYSFDSNLFNFDGVNYRYQLTVNNTTILLKDNISEIKTRGTFEGIIHLNDDYYPCEVVSSVNKNHVSTVFKYRISNYVCELSHLVQNQKTRIISKVSVDEELTQSNYVTLSYNDNIFNALFSSDDNILDLSKERNFTHKANEDYIAVDYAKRLGSQHIQYQNIKLKVSSGTKAHSHVYSYDGVEDVIINPIK